MSSSAIASALNADQFMNLLLAELKYQDPMEPISNTEMVTQMSQLASLETFNELKASFGEMLKLQQLLNGSTLLGLDVAFDGPAGPAIGRVVSLRNAGDQIKLVLADGTQLGLSQINQVF